MSSELYGVLTGDLVGSSKLSPAALDEVRDFLQGVPGQFNAVFSKSIRKGVDIVRGDGWQLLMLKPQLAIRAALYVRFSLKARFETDSRVAIGIGGVSVLHRSSLAKSSGAAFHLSGSGLDHLSSDLRMTFAMDGAESRLAAAELLLIRWLDRLTLAATQVQSASLAGSLLKMTQSELARAEKVAQPTIHRKLHVSGWQDIEAIVAYWEGIAFNGYNREI
jgi:hypothetical protein